MVDITANLKARSQQSDLRNLTRTDRTIVGSSPPMNCSRCVRREQVAQRLVNPGVNKASAVSAFLKEVLGLIDCRGIYALMY